MSRFSLPITVLVPTLNAADHLEELLDSIGDSVYEVQILDSRSLDRTVDIALDRGITVVQRAFTTHGDHFQWMVSNMPVKTDWIFLMAQDERFTPGLVERLQDVFAGGPSLNGYKVKWRLWFMGKPLHIVLDSLRLMRVGKFRISDVITNEQVLVEGDVGSVDGILEHKDTLTLYEWYEKQNLYSTMEAVARVTGKGEFSVEPDFFGGPLARRMYFKKVFFNMPFRYAVLAAYNLIIKGAWRDGKVGWRWAQLRGQVYRMREYKIEEMRRTGHIPRIPRIRHGDYDPRIMRTALQQELLPEVYAEWCSRIKKIQDQQQLGVW